MTLEIVAIVTTVVEGPAGNSSVSQRGAVMRFADEHEEFRSALRTCFAREIVPHFRQWEVDSVFRHATSSTTWRRCLRAGV
jgi:hypothetical protein